MSTINDRKFLTYTQKKKILSRNNLKDKGFIRLFIKLTIQVHPYVSLT